MPEQRESIASASLSASTVAVVASIAVAYGHVIGGIYLIAFWRRFGFQAFQYGGAAELLPAGIAAVGVLVVLVFLGAAVGRIIAEALSAPSVPAPVGHGVVIFLFVGFVAFFIWGPASRWWLALGLLLQSALTLCLLRLKLLPKRFQSFGVATGIAVATGYAPATAAFVANADADDAISNNKGWVVAVDTLDLPALREQQVKYVGRLGMSTVFYAPCTRTTWLINSNGNQPLALQKVSLKDPMSCQTEDARL